MASSEHIERPVYLEELTLVRNKASGQYYEAAQLQERLQEWQSSIRTGTLTTEEELLSKGMTRSNDLMK